jgi:hypothetical protein
MELANRRHEVDIANQLKKIVELRAKYEMLEQENLKLERKNMKGRRESTGVADTDVKYAVKLEGEVDGANEKLRTVEADLEGWKSKHAMLVESMQWKQDLHEEQVGGLQVNTATRSICI